MRRLWLAAPMALGLAACAGVERANLTEFEPLGDGHFRYEAAADSISYPPESQAAEAKRMEWLEGYLADNSYCPDGYLISSREVVLKHEALIGTGYQIFYRGECG